MVEGLPLKGLLLAVDLDGTLITGNSLHEYIRCGLRHSRLLDRLAIVAALGLRRLHIISHVEMKRRVLPHIKPTEALRDDFARRTGAMFRRSVVEEIERWREGGATVLLATAAPEVYVPWLWEGDYVCTDPHSEVECRGDEKLRRVLAYASEHGLRFAAAITDHPDDLPLLGHEGIRRIQAGHIHDEAFRKQGIRFDRCLE